MVFVRRIKIEIWIDICRRNWNISTNGVTNQSIDQSFRLVNELFPSIMGVYVIPSGDGVNVCNNKNLVCLIMINQLSIARSTCTKRKFASQSLPGDCS
jgi:hypothetical protein